MGQLQQELGWALVQQKRGACMGLQGWSLDLDWGFLVDGAEHKLHLVLRVGCFSLRVRHQAGVQQQKTEEVGEMRMKKKEESSGNDCEVEAHPNLSQLAPGSSLSGAEVMECTCLP